MSLGVIIDPGHHPRRFTPANHTLARTSTHSWHTREIKPHRNTYRFSLFSFPFSLSLSLLLFQISPPRVSCSFSSSSSVLPPEGLLQGRELGAVKRARTPALPLSLAHSRWGGLWGSRTLAHALWPPQVSLPAALFYMLIYFFFPS